MTLILFIADLNGIPHAQILMKYPQLLKLNNSLSKTVDPVDNLRKPQFPQQLYVILVGMFVGVAETGQPSFNVKLEAS